ncbi:MAG: Wzz/FepE/Etk N-terminal domain-containing protein [bacterium]
MTAAETENKARVDSDEIDLIVLARNLWARRRTILRIVIVFISIGLIIALFSKKEYTASTTIVPQTSNPSAKLGGLSSLASLAGFNLDMGAGTYDISPVLYPQIINSIQFQLEIMNTKYRFEELEEKVTLLDYYINYYRPGLFDAMKKYTIGLPAMLLTKGKEEVQEISAEEEPEMIKISEDQNEVRKIIEEKLSLSVNDKEGYLALNAEFHQAGLSAQIAQKAQKLLQEYITRFKIEKATAQFEFIEDRYNEKKKEFEDAQRRLAVFRDENKNIASAIVQTEQERLENEYQLAFEVYSELSKQLEQARIKVKEDTPVFAVIQEVAVPLEKSKPKRAMILIIWTFLGAVVGIGWIIFRINYLQIVNEKDMNNQS